MFCIIETDSPPASSVFDITAQCVETLSDAVRWLCVKPFRPVYANLVSLPHSQQSTEQRGVTPDQLLPLTALIFCCKSHSLLSYSSWNPYPPHTTAALWSDFTTKPQSKRISHIFAWGVSPQMRTDTPALGSKEEVATVWLLRIHSIVVGLRWKWKKSHFCGMHMQERISGWLIRHGASSLQHKLDACALQRLLTSERRGCDWWTPPSFCAKCTAFAAPHTRTHTHALHMLQQRRLMMLLSDQTQSLFLWVCVWLGTEGGGGGDNNRSGAAAAAHLKQCTAPRRASPSAAHLRRHPNDGAALQKANWL